MPPVFSVIVPVYNAETDLAQCIESILHQSFAGFELILVDDGSGDSSPRICERYRRSDGRVRVIRQANGGVVRARKTGVLAAAGEYVLFVDSDDAVGRDWMGKIYDVIARHRPDVVAFGMTKVRSDGSVIRTYGNRAPAGLYQKEALRALRSSLLFDTTAGDVNMGALLYGICLKAIRRQLLPARMMHVPERIKNGDDIAAAFPVICTCESLYVADITEYLYRDNAASITRTFRADDLQRLGILLDHLRLNLPGVPEQNIAAYAFFQIYDHMVRAARHFECYGAFRQYARSQLAGRVGGLIGAMHAPGLRGRHALKAAFLKRRLFFALYVLYHR